MACPLCGPQAGRGCGPSMHKQSSFLAEPEATTTAIQDMCTRAHGDPWSRSPTVDSTHRNRCYSEAPCGARERTLIKKTLHRLVGIHVTVPQHSVDLVVGALYYLLKLQHNLPGIGGNAPRAGGPGTSRGPTPAHGQPRALFLLRRRRHHSVRQAYPQRRLLCCGPPHTTLLLLTWAWPPASSSRPCCRLLHPCLAGRSYTTGGPSSF